MLLEYMFKTTIILTEINLQKIKNHKKKLEKTSVGKITLSDTLNNILESIQ